MSTDAPASLPGPAPTLTTQVMDFVRTSVIERSMVPEELYSVYQLSEQLGISRSPVRDALLRLEEAGLVRFERNRGFRIIPTRPEDVAEIFALRLALEVPAARRAGMHADEEFIITLDEYERLTTESAAADAEKEFFERDQQLHDLILGAAGSHRGREIVNRLRVSTRLLGASTAGDTRTLHDIVGEHAPILAAIRAGDAEAAGEAMKNHLRSTGQLLVAQACRRQESDLDPAAIWESLTLGY